MSNWFENYTGNCIGTYVLYSLTIVYLLGTAALYLPGCNQFSNKGEQRPIPVRSIPIRERSKPDLIDQIPTPIEEPKKKPILPKPTPKDDVEESDSALAMNRLEFRLQ